jgi:hypothetical protein
VIDWKSIDAQQMQKMESRLQVEISEARDASPLVVQAALELVSAYLDTNGGTTRLHEAVRDLARGTLGAPISPGSSMAVAVATRVLLSHDQHPDKVSSAMLRSPSEDIQLAALDWLQRDDIRISGSAIRILQNIVSDSTSLVSIRISALETLAALPLPVMMESKVPVEVATTFADTLIKLAVDARSIPLREAALSCLGLAIRMVRLTRPQTSVADCAVRKLERAKAKRTAARARIAGDERIRR